MRGPVLDLDLLDFHAQVLLAMARLDARVLAPPEFLDREFLAFELAHDRGRDLRAFDDRSADSRSVLQITDEQDPVKLDRIRVLGNILALQVQNLSLFDPVLMRTITDDRIHVCGTAFHVV